MKRWKLLVIIAIIIIILIVVGYFYSQGYLQDFEWQTATMFFAALAAPYKMVKNWLKSDKVQDILGKHEAMKEDEKKHRVETDKDIEEKQKRIELLGKQLELIDSRLEIIEAEKRKIRPDVEKMNNEELQKEGKNLFGDA
jgi:hypothetical protein